MLQRLCLILLCCVGCSSGSPEESTPIPTEPVVVIGVPSGDDHLDFTALEAGALVQLETFFQGGTHLTLAVRCVGLGKSAFVRASIENVATGARVEANTPTTNPRPLICRDETTCDLLPFLVMMSGISEPDEELNGLDVEIVVEAENAAGVSASDSLPAQLRTDDLDANR